MMSAIHTWATGLPESIWKDNVPLYWDYKRLMVEAEGFDKATEQTTCLITEEEKKAFVKKIEDLSYGGGAK